MLNLKIFTNDRQIFLWTIEQYYKQMTGDLWKEWQWGEEWQ